MDSETEKMINLLKEQRDILKLELAHHLVRIRAIEKEVAQIKPAINEITIQDDKAGM